jgi:epoxyqueuosine reductase
LAESLKGKALELGADAAGIAPAAPPPGAEGGSEAYARWLSGEKHGCLAYMARASGVRSDIRRWFPPARSVLMLAFGCFSPRLAKPSRASGRIASFALPADYHAEIKGRLARLSAWFTREASPGSRVKPFVDSSPVLERFFARLAGIGWIGKNAMLISPRLGSFFFLAGMAVDRELPPDDPVPDRCGTCLRCLGACPSGALSRPREIDASRCFACLTVEKGAGAVPERLRESLADRLFGCDDCQDACPWNRFARPGPVFRPLVDPWEPLASVLGMTPEAFLERFGPTPVRRPGLETLQRTALVLAGNSKDPSLLPKVRAFLDHPDQAVREHARWADERLRKCG